MVRLKIGKHVQLLKQCLQELFYHQKKIILKHIISFFYSDSSNHSALICQNMVFHLHSFQISTAHRLLKPHPLL